jgi:hypothetical protein
MSGVFVATPLLIHYKDARNLRRVLQFDRMYISKISLQIEITNFNISISNRVLSQGWRTRSFSDKRCKLIETARIGMIHKVMTRNTTHW